jgi:uncharacterized protein YjbI with pentapeptide repeats
MPTQNLLAASLLTGLGLSAVIFSLSPQAALAYNPAHLTQLRQTKSCPGCDLSYANLSGQKLTGADLTGANLSAANLRQVNLSQAKLVGANLNHTDLAKANLTQANLTQATLVFARLENALLDRANLTGAILAGRDLLSTVESLRGAILPNGRPAVERGSGLVSL